MSTVKVDYSWSPLRDDADLRKTGYRLHERLKKKIWTKRERDTRQRPSLQVSGHLRGTDPCPRRALDESGGRIITAGRPGETLAWGRV